MANWKTAIRGFLWCPAILWGLSVCATQMAPMEIEELAAKADVVLHGRVLEKTSLYDDRGRIYSRVELEVFERWKGAGTADRFTVVLASGAVGNKRVVVSGEANYVPGEEVVAFLRLNPRGEGVTLGLAQGKFVVWNASENGAKYARSLFIGGIKAPEGGARLQGPPEGTLTLAELKRRVQGGGR